MAYGDKIRGMIDEDTKKKRLAMATSPKERRGIHLEYFKKELEKKHGKGWFEKVEAKGRAWKLENSRREGKEFLKEIRRREKKKKLESGEYKKKTPQIPY